MSISVTVSGEDSTSIISTQPQTGLISISGDQFIDVTASSGDSATIIVSSGDPITITGNYSNYVTGDVVRPPEIADFLTENQINSKITTATGDYNTLATNLFYPKSNPSGYITGVDLSAYTTEEFVTGISGSLQGQISSNDSEITEIVNSTGSFALKSETGSFISDSQTGQFYASSNPSGFITGVDLSSYVQDSETGLFLVSGEDAVVNTIGVGGSPDNNIDIHVKSDSAKFLVENTQAGGEWVRFSAGTVGAAMKFSDTASFGIGPVASKTDTSLVDSFHMSSNGNVGIGTASPSTRLEVVGELTTAGLNSSDNIVITDNTKGLSLMSTAGTRYGLKYGLAGVLGGSDHLMLTNREANGDLLFGTSPGGGADNEVERMRITSDGNVGIGTDAPSTKLEVAGSATPTIGVINATNANFINGTDTPTINARFPTNNGSTFGSMSMGKYGGGNNGVGLRFQQVEGTDRLIFRGSSFPGAMIWSQPEAGAQLVIDIPNRAFRFTDTVFTPMRESVDLGGNTSATRWDNFYTNNGYFNGNVGIGTSSPDELLHLEATSQSSIREVLMKATVSDAGNDQFGIVNGTSANSNFAPSFYGYKGSNYGSGYIYSMNFRGIIPSSQDTTQTNKFGIIHFETFKTSSATDPNNNLDSGVSNRKVLTVANGNDTLVNIEANGNVGIGTQTPLVKLHVDGKGYFSEAIAFTTNQSTPAISNSIYRPADNSIAIGTAQTERLRVDANGNVGIGTTTPSEKLEVNGNGTFSGTLNVDQDLSVSGESSFSSRPTVNGTGVLLSGEGGGGTVENAVYTTGDQTISGTKSFGKISLSENSFVTETGSFTMGFTHRGATVLLQNSAPMTITIPAQVSGHTTTFIAETSNSVVFGTGAGISGFNSFNSANQIAGIYGQAQVIFKSPEYAFLGGNVV